MQKLNKQDKKPNKSYINILVSPHNSQL